MYSLNDLIARWHSGTCDFFEILSQSSKFELFKRSQKIRATTNVNAQYIDVSIKQIHMLSEILQIFPEVP